MNISLVFPSMLTWIKLSVLAVICSLATFQPRFRNPYLRPVRAATFGSLAIFIMVPVLHGLHKYGWNIQRQRMGVVWVLVTLVLNVSGAMAYAFKVC
jgi:adiponectin receptor